MEGNCYTILLSEVKVDDMLMTTDGADSTKLTRVELVNRIPGNFSFIDFTLESG